MIKILFIMSIVTLLLGVLLFFVSQINSFVIALILSTGFMVFFIFILHLLNIESFSKKYPTIYSFIFIAILGIFGGLLPNILEKIITNWR